MVRDLWRNGKGLLKRYKIQALRDMPWVGVMSTSQRLVMPCGWGVKAGMVREWVAGKTVWSPCYHGPYLSALAMVRLLYFTLLY